MPRRLNADAEAAAPSLVEAEVRVPSGEAVRLAVGVGLLAALVAGWQAATGELMWWAVPIRAAFVGGIAGVGAYLMLFGLFVTDERRDRKRARGVPTAEPPPLTVDVSEPQRQLVTLRLDSDTSSRYVHDIPMSAEMRRFAKRLADGLTAFSERGAADCGVSRDDFLTLRDQLLERGVLSWKNADSPRAGYTFGRGFERAMRVLGECPPPADA